MYSDRIKDIYSKDNFNEKLVKKICFSIKIRSKSLKKSDVLVKNLVHKLWSEESENLYQSVLKWDAISTVP